MLDTANITGMRHTTKSSNLRVTPHVPGERRWSFPTGPGVD